MVTSNSKHELVLLSCTCISCILYSCLSKQIWLIHYIYLQISHTVSCSFSTKKFIYHFDKLQESVNHQDTVIDAWFEPGTDDSQGDSDTTTKRIAAIKFIFFWPPFWAIRPLFSSLKYRLFTHKFITKQKPLNSGGFFYLVSPHH